jgi:hypothetical protein
MRISKSNFSADVHSLTSLPHRAFRYALYQLVDGKDTLVFESTPFREMQNCVADADEHLERLISQHRSRRVVRSAA